MERLTKRVDDNITYSQEREIECSVYCDNCVRGTADCKTVREMIKKLAEYEDAEEQGLLLRLPAKIGDTFYKIHCIHTANNRFIAPLSIDKITIYDDEIYFTRGAGRVKLSDIGKTVFLTKEEAEQALKDMESEG